jgi:glycosyltransferase involved in cell wall biosynthesis
MGYGSLVGVFDNGHVKASSVASYMREQQLDVVEIQCKGRIDWTAVREIRDCIRRHDIGLVHSHGYKADIYAYFATRKMQCPVVATSHLWTRRTSALRLYAHLDQLVLRRFNYVIAVSEAIKKETVAGGVAEDRVCVIDNGIDVTSFCTLVPSLRGEFAREGMQIVGAVGRLVEQKGFEFLLKSVPGVLERFPNTLFVVAGEGSERAKLEALAAKLKVDAQVRFIGARSDMPNVYASFDMFVLPSIDEGMPIALMEAMAAARPIVATRVAAVPKLITDGDTGILVAPRDPRALTQAICQVLASPMLRERLSRAARKRVQEHFSSETMAARYVALYHELRPTSFRVPESSLCGN